MIKRRERKEIFADSLRKMVLGTQYLKLGTRNWLPYSPDLNPIEDFSNESNILVYQMRPEVYSVTKQRLVPLFRGGPLSITTKLR